MAGVVVQRVHRQLLAVEEDRLGHDGPCRGQGVRFCDFFTWRACLRGGVQAHVCLLGVVAPAATLLARHVHAATTATRHLA
jgi:hypothetical protein